MAREAGIRESIIFGGNVTREQLYALYEFVISAAQYAAIEGNPLIDPRLRDERQFSQVKAIADMDRLFLDPQHTSKGEQP